jgi:hypothetical protein
VFFLFADPYQGFRLQRRPMPHMEPDTEDHSRSQSDRGIPHPRDKFAGGTKKFPAPAADRIRKFAYSVLELRGEFTPAVAERAPDLKKIPATFPAGRELEDQARCGFGVVCHGSHFGRPRQRPGRMRDPACRCWPGGISRAHDQGRRNRPLHASAVDGARRTYGAPCGGAQG